MPPSPSSFGPKSLRIHEIQFICPEKCNSSLPTYFKTEKASGSTEASPYMYLDEKGKKRTNYRLMSCFSVQPNFVQNLFCPDGSRAKKLQKERRNNCRNKSGLLSVRHYVAPASRATSLACNTLLHTLHYPARVLFFIFLNFNLKRRKTHFLKMVFVALASCVSSCNILLTKKVAEKSDI